MSERERILHDVRAALRGEPRVGVDRFPVRLEFADGVLTVEGELGNVAAKKLALERASAVRGVDGIIDRLRVEPAQRMGDGQIRDLVRDALLQEPTLAEAAIRERVKGAIRVVRDPVDRRRGEVVIAVDDGVVTLDGDVPSLAHKRLAGVLAWWVPGSRDVINGLGVTPPEEDNDGEITEAVRTALEKDPFVNASQIRVSTRNAVVTLTGVVPSDSEREMAEFDSWYVFGVDDVRNAIEVHR